MPRKTPEKQSAIEPRQWSSTSEIDRGIAKLKRRITEIEAVDIQAAIVEGTSADNVALSNLRETIREVFGQNSPEFREHEHIQLFSGPLFTGMNDNEIIATMERGRKHVIGTIHGLIGRLEEKREEFEDTNAPAPRAYFDYLNLHPRIVDVASDLFRDGYPWEAVFAASKALVNYVKERSGQHDLDGANLMRKVFSRNSPILVFNDLSDETDLDEQQGMMHLFEGVVLGIRNPGGHSFPEGPEQRAIEYLSLISLLAYRVQEAKRATGST
jgi:uncharacterized protein (TIGR02391 family)